MPRTRRYIFNTLTVVSLLLMLATVGLALLSIVENKIRLMHWELPGGPGSNKGLRINYSKPNLRVSLHRYRPSKGPVWTRSFTHLGLAGFSQGIATQSATGAIIERRTIFVNGFLLILLFAITPAIWFVKWRKRRKLGPNSCGNCGYDLTANTTGECPECGKSTEAAQV